MTACVNNLINNNRQFTQWKLTGGMYRLVLTCIVAFMKCKTMCLDEFEKPGN